MERPTIYQLMVRHFGNTGAGGVLHGSIEENGCGKFVDINDAALRSLKEFGVTHLWLTGVLEHASLTAYPGRPADEESIIKGRAGSPYAVRDYFDVSPDYAVDPSRRLEEFGELLVRCKAHGFRVLLDFIPNHVARSYESDVFPELSFGSSDDRGVFFDRDNNFFYLGPDDPGGGPPLVLPRQDDQPGIVFEGEREFGRVTGNNVRSWAPSVFDWYETVKLNYGHDYTTGTDTRHLPGPDASEEEVPDTWRKIDAVLAYWQEMGADGFRVDMAHMVPMEFWNWVTRRARARQSNVFFMAEAYDGDPAKLTDGDVLRELATNGFDGSYDSASYELIQQIYEGPKWANDLDHVLAQNGHQVRYAENHDEVRLASPLRWGGHGMAVGRPVSAVLLGTARGPIMLYNGQEVGEPALGAAGFSGDDGRTSIFDYVVVPELAKWVNDHRYDGGGLSPEQRELRTWYGKLLHICAEPNFRNSEFVPLNPANLDNPAFGRVGDETASGHWLYAFLRLHWESGKCFLNVVNLHGREALTEVRVRVPGDVLREAGMEGERLAFRDRLASDWTATASTETLMSEGLALPELPAASALFLEMSRAT